MASAEEVAAWPRDRLEKVLCAMREWANESAHLFDTEAPQPVLEFMSVLGVLKAYSTPAIAETMVDAITGLIPTPENAIQREIADGRRATLLQTFFLYAIAECDVRDCARETLAFFDDVHCLAGYDPAPNPVSMRAGYGCQGLEGMLAAAGSFGASTGRDLRAALLQVYGHISDAMALNAYLKDSGKGQPLTAAELVHVEHVRTVILSLEPDATERGDSRLDDDGGELRRGVERLLATIDLLPDRPWLRSDTSEHAAMIRDRQDAAVDAMVRSALEQYTDRAG